jgi:hypothetical protein
MFFQLGTILYINRHRKHNLYVLETQEVSMRVYSSHRKDIYVINCLRETDAQKADVRK